MELEEIKNMHIDPKFIRENMMYQKYGEITPETELVQLIYSNTHRPSGRYSDMKKVEGRDWIPMSVSHIDKFVRTYLPTFFYEYIYTKKEIFSYMEDEKGKIDKKKLPDLYSGKKDKHYLGECCHYSLCLVLGLQEYYNATIRDKDGRDRDEDGKEYGEVMIYPRWSSVYTKLV